MEKELLEFIKENELSPFNKLKTLVRAPNNSILKTKDAKLIYSKVLKKISRNFAFLDTSNLFLNLPFTTDENEILKRQNFFKAISKDIQKDFLRNIELDIVSWRPPYSVLVVTEDDKTFLELNKMNCPTKILLNDRDVSDLEEMDIVQVINCENYSRTLERLPQSIFLGGVDEAYLERHVILLSKWQEIIKSLKEIKINNEIDTIINEIYELLPLLDKKNSNKITQEFVEISLEKIKDEIAIEVREMTIKGSALIEVLSKGIMPKELKALVSNAISKTNLPSEIFIQKIPVEIDEGELDKIIKKQSLNEFSEIAEKIQSKSKDLKDLPKKFSNLEIKLLIYDFCAGISHWMGQNQYFPEINRNFSMEKSKNIFLENPHPITFNLTDKARCSILTGANSGGKTTLLEHILQVIICMQIGLPFKGKIQSPIFSDIYYFAKNKGSMSKGAFETLLTQMSEITPGEKTLILADEIEAVTEPGIAGKMICATANFFINKKCFMVIATHLGQEISKNLPKFSRIDGICATGISEDNELIVDHNPILGKLAHSTPELIIEKMVRSQGGEYFNFLYDNIKGNKEII